VNSPIKIDKSVNSTGGLGVNTTQARPAKGSGGAAKAGSVSNAPTDSVKLSTQAQAVSGQLSSSGVFDAKKVEEIKAAIADGTFKVDPEKVAAGLLDTVTDLLHSRKSQK
jgi:negative regulator of flagellin synthesis FlgM